MEQGGAHGTFFWLGSMIERAPEIVIAAAEAGHAIANHTFSHVRLDRIDRDAFFDEVLRTQSLIEELAGDRAVRYLRPPYGATDANTRTYAADLGFSVVMWDVDSNDWRQPGADAISTHVIENARAGSVVVMHDGGGDRTQTVSALETILPELAGMGFELNSL